MKQGSEEWLDARRTRIGGSDAPVIMGVSPWCSLIQLWRRKMGFDPEPDCSWAMQRGIDMEEEARKAYEDYTGNIMFPNVKIHMEHDWMIGSVDGLTMEGDILLEIKCPGKEDHEKAKNGSIPEKYYPQCQHYLEIYGAKELHYWSYREGEGALVKVLPDKEYIKDLLEKELEFVKCLRNCVAPVTEMNMLSHDEFAFWEAEVIAWQKAKKEVIEASRREKLARQRIIEMADGKNYQHGAFSVCKEAVKGRLDYKRIPELKGVDLEKYRSRPTERWVIYGISNGDKEEEET